ncbi:MULTISPECIES: FeoA family protein [Nitratiruptor]|uniref:Ferrous iron transport protein A n=1 Tax=Nitratiruptor tergarcus DSM 16512 TaxID=1069081 RepID=A0A1W1WUG7_9BACT|nr:MULTISPECIES: FeoA family protein [Nitratiruptor]BCD62434.1 ferrous iron transport protein A [Nitratiruptor sp. YY08-13]BCD66370.1 ferrous iron transport protein A [Nitratiruptor sp. YY08-26]SMC09842.1 ferrous iron transport protein A [Nitratiruptor tergarcus DSM 16512]
MSRKLLSQMLPKEKGIIKKIGAIGELKDRLLELGALTNTPIEVVRIAPFGDPIEIKIGNTHIALRKSEASKIEVELFKEKDD